jgi:hypothetical protein
MKCARCQLDYIVSKTPFKWIDKHPEINGLCDQCTWNWIVTEYENMMEEEL